MLLELCLCQHVNTMMRIAAQTAPKAAREEEGLGAEALKALFRLVAPGRLPRSPLLCKTICGLFVPTG